MIRYELFRRLKEAFTHVVVVCENEAAVTTVVKQTNKPPELKMITYGESYRVNCPFCTDTRKRLWINHLWGYKDPEVNSLNLWLATCFNEDCLKEHHRQKSLYEKVFDQFTSEISAADYIGPTHAITYDSKPFVWPGEMRLLSSLPADHPANRYITTRNFNPAELSELYDVRYCVSADVGMEYAQNRIIIPIYFEQQPIGWQARYIGTPPSKRTPKYISMHGWKKSFCLYNYDNAIKNPFVVVCEGPADVWRAGPGAVALFGKKMSSKQLQLLSRWPLVIVLLDSDVDEEHDLQALVDQLNLNKVRNIVLRIPTKDPGDMDETYLRTAIMNLVKRHAPEVLTCKELNPLPTTSS